MPLSGPRLNMARYTSILSDIQTQFPIPGGLLPAELAMLQSYQQKLAHAVTDHEGSDVVTEIQVNALVATNDVGTVTAGIAAGDPVVATGTGTVS